MSDGRYSPSMPHSKIIDRKRQSPTLDTDMSGLYPNLNRPTFSEKDPDKNNLDMELELDEDDDYDEDSLDHKDEIFDVPR